MIGSIKNQEANLVGHISNSEPKIKGHICYNSPVLVGHLLFPSGYDDYEGRYDITPNATKQVLSTTDKHMKSDVVVNKIPYYEVENTHSGITVVIGGN